VSHALDRAVRAAAEALRPSLERPPRALFLMGTGAGELGARLATRAPLALADVEGVPEPWRSCELHVGRLGEVELVALDDLSGDPLDAEGAAWTSGFPCWLGAALGARVLVHTSAGAALPCDEEGAGERPAVGSLALLSDHVNLSGSTPLVGLGASRLGPLFPDVSRLHDAGLRAAALAGALERGLDACEAVAACTCGPSLDTPAEERWRARAGAQVSVQGLAAPLLAAAHAGLTALCTVAVTGDALVASDWRRSLEAAQRAAPAVEDLLLSLDVALAAAVAERDDEPAP